MKTDNIKPFFKSKRKRRTIIFGGIPLFLSVYVTVLYILFYLCGLDPKSNDHEMLLLIPALIPGYLIYAVIFVPLSFIEFDANIFREKVMMVSPILFYIFLFLLFLIYCHYYRTKRIKAYKKMKRILTVIWVIFSFTLIIAALNSGFALFKSIT